MEIFRELKIFNSELKFFKNGNFSIFNWNFSKIEFYFILKFFDVKLILSALMPTNQTLLSLAHLSPSLFKSKISISELKHFAFKTTQVAGHNSKVGVYNSLIIGLVRHYGHAIIVNV